MRRTVGWMFGAVVSACVSACGAHDGEPSTANVATVAAPLQASPLTGQSLKPKQLALTFDDGPGDQTKALSTYLVSQGIRATFFVNGDRVTRSHLPNPNDIDPTDGATGILAQLVADGHLVANHTVTHRDLVTEVLPTGGSNLLAELTETNADIAGYIPSGHRLFRPPYGSWSSAVSAALPADVLRGYVGPVSWDIGGTTDGYPSAAADWACWQGQLRAGSKLVNGTGYATTKQCGDAYLKEIDAVGRGILLMHDPYSWAQGSTLDMIQYLVPLLKAKGYTFVRADEVPEIAAQLPPCDASCATCSGPGATACTACAPGRYLDGASCQACQVCADGQIEVAACTTTADTVCKANEADAGPPSCDECSDGGESDGSTPPGKGDASVAPAARGGTDLGEGSPGVPPPTPAHACSIVRGPVAPAGHVTWACAVLGVLSVLRRRARRSAFCSPEAAVRGPRHASGSLRPAGRRGDRRHGMLAR